MKARETTIRLKRREMEEQTRKVADLERIIREFDQMATDLERQIQLEEDRTGIRDRCHFSYSTFAKAAAQRRANLLTSVADLKAKLDRAKRDHEAAVLELGKLEPSEIHDGDRQMGKPDSNRLMIG